MNRGSIRIGDRFCAVGFQVAPRIAVGRGAELLIGDNFFINEGATIHCYRAIEIGSNVQVADGASISDTNFHEIDAGAGVSGGRVVVGDSVWIGRNATITPGVTIGRYSVVAAGAVVTKDVPEAVLVGGVPARIIRAIQVAPGFSRA